MSLQPVRVPAANANPRSPWFSLSLALLLSLAARVEAQCSVTVPAPTPAAPTPINDALINLGGASGTCPGGPWTLNLSPGTYHEQVVIPANIEVTINGALPFVSTILDGTGLGGSVVVYSGGQTNASVLQNLAIVNGNAFQGGGILVMQDARPVLRNLQIANCTALADGGAVFIDATFTGAIPFQVLRMSRIELRSNHADGTGGAVAVRGTYPAMPMSPPDDVLIKLCDFKGNSAGNVSFGFGGFGGGLDSQGGRVVRVDHSTAKENRAENSGGAFSIGEFGSLRITECVVQDNTATGATAFGDFGGGGLYAASSILCEVVDSTFTSNRAGTVPTFATAYGGHVMLRGGLPASRRVLIRNDLFHLGKSDSGGGVAVYDETSADVELCTFNANTALNGGAIYTGAVSNQTPRLRDSILWQDVGTNPSPLTASTEIYGSLVPDVALCDIQHPGLSYPATFGVNLNVAPQWIPGNGCVYAPIPLFYLAAGSPCINAGSLPSPYPQTGLGFTTDRTGAPDVLAVNLGFHYPGPGCP